MGRSKKLEGTRIGKLSIIEYIGWIKKKSWYKCVCDCGNVFNRRADILIEGVDRCKSDCPIGNKPRADKGTRRKPDAWKLYSCDICGEEYERLECTAAKKHNFCSKDCRRKGIKFWMNGELNHSYIENREDLSDIRQSIEGKSWILKVFKRDDYRCTVCKEHGKIQAHHLKSFTRFPEFRFDLNNGATMCEECHKEFHSLYGIRKFTSDDYYEFKKEMEVEDELLGTK